MFEEKARLNLRNRLGYKWHVTRMVEHPNSLSWVRVHLWMWTPELVELSPSSLMGGLHDCLIAYMALMCKLSMYPNYIPMCSTGKVLLKWRNIRDVKRRIGKWCEMDILNRYVFNPRVEYWYNHYKVIRWWGMMFRNVICVLVMYANVDWYDCLLCYLLFAYELTKHLCLLPPSYSL